MRGILLAVTLALAGQMACANTYTDCTKAVAAGDQAKAKKLAQTILGFNFFTPDQRDAGAACLTFAMGKQYIFSTVLDRFAPKTEEDDYIAKKKKEGEDWMAAQAKKQKEDAVWKRVYDACVAMYRDNPNAAVTNQICLNMFLVSGLPDQ